MQSMYVYIQNKCRNHIKKKSKRTEQHPTKAPRHQKQLKHYI